MTKCYEGQFMHPDTPIRPPKRSFRITDRPLPASALAHAPRFTVERLPGVVYARVDRDSFFDGETRVSFVFGVRVSAPGGVWERFNESEVVYV